jgi:hypothetical protein
MSLPAGARYVRGSLRATAGVTFVGWSAVDDGHVGFVVALAGGRSEVVEPLDAKHAG